KMLEFMACGRPLVAGLEGESAALVKRADAGICVPPEDAGALAEAIRTLRRDPALARKFGDHARAYITQKLSRESTARDYRALLSRIGSVRGRRTEPVQPAPQNSGQHTGATQ